MNFEVANKNEDLLIKNHVSNNSSELSEIFNEDVNISIWKRHLDNQLINASNYIINENPDLQFSELVKYDDVDKILVNNLGQNENTLYLVKDISRVVKLFCDLFSINKVWLRLDAIESPMCPRFHVDNLKCRLVSTYKGPATQWLPHNLVNRDKLGHGNNGMPDEESGLFLKETDIKELNTGDVALLKGDGWKNNQGKGLVHRSPHKVGDYKRLYMTIDFIDLYLRIFKNHKNES